MNNTVRATSWQRDFERLLRQGFQKICVSREVPEIMLSVPKKMVDTPFACLAQGDVADIYTSRSVYCAYDQNGNIIRAGYAGGVALAAYILDNHEIVAGKTVLDVGTGSGLVAIAASISGASSVVGLDSDQWSPHIAQLNATENQAANIEFRHGHFPVDGQGKKYDVILAADVFYAEGLFGGMHATSVQRALLQQAKNGATVIVASAREETPALNEFGAPLVPTRSGLEKLKSFRMITPSTAP